MNMLTKEMNKVKTEHKNEIYNIKLENEIEKAVDKSGAKTGKAVRALLNMNEIKLNDNGEITGIKEQLESLINNDDTKYLFNEKEKISFEGVSVGVSNGKESSFDNMSYDEICACLEDE